MEYGYNPTGADFGFKGALTDAGRKIVSEVI